MNLNSIIGELPLIFESNSFEKFQTCCSSRVFFTWAKKWEISFYCGVFCSMKKIYAIELLYFSILYQYVQSTVHVNTKLGNIKGTTRLSRDGKRFNAFLGVPYAQPPIEDLRFEVSAILLNHINLEIYRESMKRLFTGRLAKLFKQSAWLLHALWHDHFSKVPTPAPNKKMNIYFSDKYIIINRHRREI